jgi:hypothetical protein
MAWLVFLDKYTLAGTAYQLKVWIVYGKWHGWCFQVNFRVFVCAYRNISSPFSQPQKKIKKKKERTCCG